MANDAQNRATLDGLDGAGYAVVESLASLGKGRRLTGLFRTSPAHRAHLTAEMERRKRVRFDGLVHFRDQSKRSALDVELAKIEDDADGQLLVEFAAEEVPYSI
jgi:hypothetical protein